MIDLVEFLRTRGLMAGQRLKLARHRDKRWDLELILRTGHFDSRAVEHLDKTGTHNLIVELKPGSSCRRGGGAGG